jgi:hypothetical protein
MTRTLQKPTPTGNPSSSLRIAAAMAGVLVLGACASAPQEPKRELDAAAQAIAAAEQSRAANYAPLELREAREKLTAARAAVQREKMEQAERLAVESRVNAELASAKAAELKAKAVNEEMQKSTETLEQEMERNTGDLQ